ncbi:MAG: cytochrome B [Deltaproteobacteria bacterium]|nr:MAG: cytochrome B [Deltaproteobacteria bacterium]
MSENKLESKITKIYLFTRYERFWHWLQVAMIFTLIITGLEIHDLFGFLGFEKAVATHNTIGISWLIAFGIFAFWVFTTGEWRQYIPTEKKMMAVIRYYSYGIFKGESHPFPTRREAKHNPVQRLAYLALATLLLPLQMLTGFLYWSYNSWEAWGLNFLTLKEVAAVHMAGAFAIASFIIVHVYMTTTGHTVFAHIKAMITGWEEVETEEDVNGWDQRTH